jgi:hypothetical protein
MIAQFYKVLGSRSRGVEIKLPSGIGAGAEIRYCGCGSGSFLLSIYQRLEEILFYKSWLLKKYFSIVTILIPLG